MSILRRKPRVHTSSQPPTITIWLDFDDDGATTLTKLETLCTELRKNGARDKDLIHCTSRSVLGEPPRLSAYLPWRHYPHDHTEAAAPFAADYDLDFDETGRPL